MLSRLGWAGPVVLRSLEDRTSVSVVGASFLEGRGQPREAFFPLLVLGGPQEEASVSPSGVVRGRAGSTVQPSPEHSTEEDATQALPPTQRAAFQVAGRLVCSAGPPSLPGGLLPSLGAGDCGREASSSWGSLEHSPSPAGVGLDHAGASPPLQAAAHCALDRLVTGPLAGWLGRLINILRNDLAMGSGTACHWGLMAGFLSSFPIVSAIFTTGRPAAPSPRRLTRWGLGDSPVWFLAEGLGESMAWKGNRQGLDYASLPIPPPALPP